ncbi:porin [Neisseriaceae bacterium B1]
MKKTLIALSLLTLSSVSMADVVLYGKIRGGIEVEKIKGVDGTKTQIVDYTSIIGFKGQEQLNGDLKAIWQMEQTVDIGGGDNGGKQRGFGTRNSFIGLKGGFGEIRAGHQHNPVGDFVDNYDVWENASAIAPGLNVYDRGNDVVKRRVAVQYITPKFNDFEARLYVSPSDNNDKNAANPTMAEESAAYGVGLHYAPAQGFFGEVMGGYVRNGENNIRGKKGGYQVATNFGFKNDEWLLKAAYQYARDVDNDPFKLNNGAVNVTRMHQAALTAAYNIPNSGWMPKLSAAYGWGIREAAAGQDEVKTLGNGKYWQAVVGANYKFSKRTTSNFQFGYLQAGKNTAQRDKLQAYGLSIGLRHDF